MSGQAGGVAGSTLTRTLVEHNQLWTRPESKRQAKADFLPAGELRHRHRVGGTRGQAHASKRPARLCLARGRLSARHEVRQRRLLRLPCGVV
jgi:hypothetical protein